MSLVVQMERLPVDGNMLICLDPSEIQTSLRHTLLGQSDFAKATKVLVESFGVRGDVDMMEVARLFRVRI